MNSHWLMTGGSVFEVAGTFLLAVEAIKIPNLRLLREHVLNVAESKINPVIKFVDGTDTDTSERETVRLFPNIVLVSFMVIGLAILYAVLRLTGHSLNDAWRVFSSFISGPD